jgi:hypothetical protein
VTVLEQLPSVLTAGEVELGAPVEIDVGTEELDDTPQVPEPGWQPSPQ